ncbi:hypothetical protein GCM10010191_34560 [Actinomadura vinacea]|uniref:Uncharacterized protein n=1 Tax=Actinomadura vinacea TaxID=115336 RepID=A0ABN3J2B7_9ACTN
MFQQLDARALHDTDLRLRLARTDQDGQRKQHRGREHPTGDERRVPPPPGQERGERAEPVPDSGNGPPSPMRRKTGNDGRHSGKDGEPRVERGLGGRRGSSPPFRRCAPGRGVGWHEGKGRRHGFSAPRGWAVNWAFAFSPGNRGGAWRSLGQAADLEVGPGLPPGSTGPE